MFEKRHSSMLLVTLVLLMAANAFSKKCPSTKEMFRFSQNIRLRVNFSSIRLKNTENGQMHLRSISPWNYSINMDEKRFPAAINVARCLHTNCLDSEGNIDFSLVSVPILQEMFVLRREVKGCTTCFWLEKQTVPVGCTCVRAHVEV
ncbi:interleukin-17A-like [Xenopus laevis]|uniref:Interleukin-17A-like n=2 Tax=Xenopus laevis TaxID=8355 RepID=A0A1L8GCG2_XENLA|nr:interleukin-17A-like [Xenopus laevis]OCT81396.1 hypothetical protein XELAEV_18028216mg [Xenopus laevis]